MAEEVHTFHELEAKTRGCKITGPCAWQFSFGPTDVSVIAPEPHVIYHYSLHPINEHDTTSEYWSGNYTGAESCMGLTDTRGPFTHHTHHTPTAYRIRGQFPKVRYFSIQTYTFMRQPIDGIADYEIQPVSGANPFAEPLPEWTHGENGHFQVYITANGDRGYPNELKAYHPDRLLTQLSHRNASWGTFLMGLRYYASDPCNDQTVPWGRGRSLFGFVDPPIVEWRKNGG